MYGCESWTVKKAERRRIDAFELWCWRRLSRVPWTARRSNQSFLKEISPRISLERMMLKLKLQYFGHLMRRVDSLEVDSDAERDWGQEEKGTTEDEMAGWHHWLDRRESERTPGVGFGQGSLACCNSWDCKESDTTEWLNWTELNPLLSLFILIISCLRFGCENTFNLTSIFMSCRLFMIWGALPNYSTRYWRLKLYLVALVLKLFFSINAITFLHMIFQLSQHTQIYIWIEELHLLFS